MPRTIGSFALACAILFTCASGVAEEIRDYYAEPGLNPFKDSLNQHFNEHVDPFSGTLQLKYTDLSIPGNGGMDLNVTRVYTSLQTNQYPSLGLNGLGWVMHFGRVVTSRDHVDKLCNQHEYPLTTKENLSLELPDGGRELLVLNHVNNDSSLITRSNWRARCLSDASGLLVTSPNGTKYTMNRKDTFQGEPSWFTTRIEDLEGNWIRIDYHTNAAGVAYIHEIYRSEEGGATPIVSYEYQDEATAAIKVKAIIANGQRTEYRYETIPGFHSVAYQQLVEVRRPDGRTWEYSYNPKFSDPDPNDGVTEDGPASFSLIRVKYPYGAAIDYTYRYMQFDPGSAERTTVVQTKTTSGGGIPGATWTYQFAPHSSPFPDGMGGTLHYDVTTVAGPHDVQKFYHFGKDYRGLPGGGQVFVRPALVGLLAKKEIYDTNDTLLERSVNSWGARLISNEDFWHGAGYRDWWRDNGTYAPVLVAEYRNRDRRASEEVYYHYKQYFEHDAYGNPGRIYENTNIIGTHAKQTRYTYFIDTTKWIVQRLKDEVHEEVPDAGAARVLGSIERTLDASGKLRKAVAFGVETNYTYTTAGDLESVRDARGNIHRFSQYKRGIAQREELPEGVVITREVNDTGTVASEGNGRGHVTGFSYDSLNRLSGIDFPVGADVAMTYSPGDDGMRRVLTRGAYQQVDTLNDFGQMLRGERRDTASGQLIYRTKRFDASGREIFTSYPNSAEGITITYDALGRIRRTEHPDGAGTDYAYDEAEATVTNERRFVTKFRYLVRGVDFSAKRMDLILAPERVGTIIRRDTLGNTIEIFQGEVVGPDTVRGYGKSYDYDARQRLVRSVEPEVGITLFGHDEIGNVTSERVNGLEPTTFDYDGLNRRTLTNFPGDTPDVAVGYDKNSNVEWISRGAAARTTYVYDANDNLLSETLSLVGQLFGARSYRIAHAYNDLDVESQVTYPSDLVVDYAPDALGRATRVGSFASQVTYHPGGQVRSYRLANGVVTNIALNRRLLAERINAGSLVDLNYSYDAAGNVTSIVDGVAAANSVDMQDTGSYDGLDRLLSAEGPWGIAQFSYDVFSNLRMRRVGGVSSSIKLDARYRPTGSFTDDSSNGYRAVLSNQHYDLRGNLSRNQRHDVTSGSMPLGHSDFRYDAASNLIRAAVLGEADPAVVAKDYAYDGNGLRVIERRHGTYAIRYSVHSRSGQLLFEDSIADCTRTDYVRLGALSIARSDERSADPALDGDSDQLNDCIERQLGLDPANGSDAAGDVDGDGVSNLLEYRAGTSLTARDTDGDGLTDAQELNQYLTDPTLADSDGDGLSDAVEASDPRVDALSADGDHDGVSDYWELQVGSDPQNPADGRLDYDADGFSNRQESLSGSEPTRAGSLPERGAQMWVADLGEAFRETMLIAKSGVVYATSWTGITALNPDGTVRWRFAAPAGQRFAAPTIAEDATIYVVGTPAVVQSGQPRGYIYALREDGTLRWTYASSNSIDGSVAIGSQSQLFVAGTKWTPSGLFGFYLNAALEVVSKDGTLAGVAVMPEQGSFVGTPAISASGNVYATESNGTVRAFDEARQLRWTYTLRTRPVGEIAIGPGATLYLVDGNGYAYAINATGELRWDRQLSTTGAYEASGVLGSDGTLYFGIAGKLVAVNSADGSILWTADIGGNLTTPTIAADGTLYITRQGAGTYAYSPSGVQSWRSTIAADTAPMLDQDSTLYVSSFGQIMALADRSGGLAASSWPTERHDAAATSLQCFSNTAYTTHLDTDGDGIEDCVEAKLGLDPRDPADALLDSDADGLSNLQEVNLGTNAAAADTDGDGLPDGLEVLTYHTNPLSTDTDGDLLSDAQETTWQMDPLDPADALSDADGDGFSIRQEVLANTNPASSASVPVTEAVLKESNVGYSPDVAVAAGPGDTIYLASGAGLEALRLDLTRKWLWPTAVSEHPAVGADGTIYVATSTAGGQRQRLVALLPDGSQFWSYPLDTKIVYDPPAIGSDGTLFWLVRDVNAGAQLYAIDKLGFLRWSKFVGSSAYPPTVAVGRNGRIVTFSRDHGPGGP